MNTQFSSENHQLVNVDRERYNSLDGLRAYAAIGIVLMHILANIAIKPSENYITLKLIPFFTDFTLLFMIVSGFSLCCGYYDRIKSGDVTPNTFYKKCYARILPYFASLCILDLMMNPSLKAFYETFANLTLCFNLLPNPKIGVIGVGWFLGVIFLFYILFPFFVFMLDNKRRAWKSLVIALVFVLIAMLYFYTPEFVPKSPGRTNMIFCAPLFLSGGIAYLYRKPIFDLVRTNNLICVVFVIALTVSFFLFGPLVKNEFAHYIIENGMFVIWLLYAIGSRDIILNNRVVKYISGISMEIYLAHMVIYRVVEKIHIDHFISQPDILYIVTCILVIGGVICFAHVMKYYALRKVMNWMEKKNE